MGIKIKNNEISESTSENSNTFNEVKFSWFFFDLYLINKNIGAMKRIGNKNFSIAVTHYLKNNFAFDAIKSNLPQKIPINTIGIHSATTTA
jgi:hypothetical protein